VFSLRSPQQKLESVIRRHELPPGTAAALGALLEQFALADAPTAVHDPAAAVDVHVADSLAGLEVAELRRAAVIADIGAGAGIPGLVLAAALPDARVVLVEAAARKCAFIRRAIAAMRLENAEVVWSRAEQWREGVGSCDVVSARALAALPVLCEYAAPLLREGGIVLAWKGAIRSAEAEDTEAAARHLGLAHDAVRHVVPYAGSERRTLHVLRKVAPTPSQYPRRPGIASKRPLSARNLR
jgi:16S rRNA (guanine527-N7)-methyltransferase